MDEQDRAVLKLAAMQYRAEGHRIDAARELGYRSVDFWLRVNRLVNDPAANVAEPVLCGQLRRVRAARMARRAA